MSPRAENHSTLQVIQAFGESWEAAKPLFTGNLERWVGSVDEIADSIIDAGKLNGQEVTVEVLYGMACAVQVIDGYEEENVFAASAKKLGADAGLIPATTLAGYAIGELARRLVGGEL